MKKEKYWFKEHFKYLTKISAESIFVRLALIIFFSFLVDLKVSTPNTLIEYLGAIVLALLIIFSFDIITAIILIIFGILRSMYLCLKKGFKY